MSTLPKIIAVDFDGTLFENAWPDVGAPIEKNVNKLKAEQAEYEERKARRIDKK